MALSERTCIGCGSRDARGALVRIVRDARGGVVVDARGGAPGRGAHLHPRRACLERALRSGVLSRAFRAKVEIRGESLTAIVGSE